MERPTVLILEVADSLGEMLSTLLSRNGFQAVRVRDESGVASCVERNRPDAILLGPSMIERAAPMEFARQMRKVAGNVPLVLIAKVSSEDLAITALRAGVREYVKNLSSPEEIVSAVRRCLQEPEEPLSPKRDIPALEGSECMVGNSAAMQDVRQRIGRVALTDSNVLVTGETGTGKELIAQLVHRNGLRREKPFVTINCAAIPDSLFESELFGFEKGAFTGAQLSSEGKIRAANGGTVFLDEVGDMSVYGQSKMLRLIESREVQRLGRSTGVRVDVRLIAATNRDLEALTEEHTFRKDLFFRLAVTSIRLPPLRERKDDLTSLLAHYIAFFNKRFRRSVERLSDRSMDCMVGYDWPGNVRELKNLIEAAFVELPSPAARVCDLPAAFYDRCNRMRSVSGTERDRLIGALLATNWNKSRAASQLRWSRMTLYRKLAQYNIQRNHL